MPEAKQVAEIPKSRVWMLNWMRDELWWRDVAKSVTSGLIVILLAALFAGAAGLISQRWFITTILVILVVAVIWASLTVSARLYRRMGSGPLYWLVSSGLAVVALAICAPAYIYIFQW